MFRKLAAKFKKDKNKKTASTVTAPTPKELLIQALSTFEWFDENKKLSLNLMDEQTIAVLSWLTQINALNALYFNNISNDANLCAALFKLSKLNLIINDYNKAFISNIIFEMIDERILTLINENVLSGNDLDYLCQLSSQSEAHLFTQIERLKQNNMLNAENFKAVLQTVCSKTERLEELSVNKEGQELILDGDRKLILDNDDQNELKGSYGKITKAYEESISENPTHAIKELFPVASEMTLEKCARHEAKYLNLLGRSGFWFTQNDNVFVGSIWHKGKTIWDGKGNSNITTFSNYSYEKRLHALTMGLSDLDKLHSLYRVHGDINPRNFIVNEKGEMYLIDFGSARKQGSKRNYGCTLAFLDRMVGCEFYDFHDDIYSMGIVVASMFPEIFSIRSEGNKFKVNVVKSESELTIFERAICNLVQSMMNKDRGKRCHSKDALSYIQKISDHYDQLTSEIMKSISESTLDRVSTTVDDILRGRNRVGR